MPPLAAALSQLQHGDADGAVKRLRGITSAEPRNADAWRALGMAYLRLRRFDPAISALQRSLKIAPDSPRIFYSLGGAYAAKHDSERAFEWLKKARASHRYDMTELSEDTNLTGLRADPRFASLLPSEADFERPFIESVKIIREWRGEAAGDQFGWIARNIGDVDSDGVTDIVPDAAGPLAATSGMPSPFISPASTDRSYDPRRRLYSVDSLYPGSLLAALHFLLEKPIGPTVVLRHALRLLLISLMALAFVLQLGLGD